MYFVYNKWDDFCSRLKKRGILSIPARDVVSSLDSFLVLKHDVENNVKKAYVLANIEYNYGHRGTYYVHSYLFDNDDNVRLLLKMQDMGHEISYHYDVMDSNHGDIQSAITEFTDNISKIEKLGFNIVTVCQHGNPIVERVGYTSNRDFFRSDFVRKKFSNISDIMVNYKENFDVDYSYYSDAGRRFKFIYDPINNDIINSDEKNIPYDSLDDLLENLDSKSIVSTHPHRWEKNLITYFFKEKLFKFIKVLAKLLVKIPLLKKIMSKYYYLAKKI